MSFYAVCNALWEENWLNLAETLCPERLLCKDEVPAIKITDLHFFCMNRDPIYSGVQSAEFGRKKNLQYTLFILLISVGKQVHCSEINKGVC